MTRPASCNLYGLLLFGFLGLAACDKDQDSGSSAGAGTSAPAASAQSADEQLAELSDYRLSMDKFDKYIAAQRNIMLKGKDMSPAEREAMEARNDAKDNSNASLDDMVRNVESEPMMTAAVRDAGLSPREFALIGMAFMQTAMAAGIVKMRPNDNQDSLIRAMKASPENVKFLRDNEAEVTRKQAALAAEMERLGLDDGS